MPTHCRNQTQTSDNPHLNKQTRNEVAAKKTFRQKKNYSRYASEHFSRNTTYRFHGHFVACSELNLKQAHFSWHFDAEMFVGQAGCYPASRCAVEEAYLDQEGLVDLFKCILLLG